MKQENRNIEDFLKEKLDHFDGGFQNDWSQFEIKLKRAILYYRLKVGAVVSAILILISLGIAENGNFRKSSAGNHQNMVRPSLFESIRRTAFSSFRPASRGFQWSSYQSSSKAASVTESPPYLVPVDESDPKTTLALNTLNTEPYAVDVKLAAKALKAAVVESSLHIKSTPSLISPAKPFKSGMIQASPSFDDYAVVELPHESQDELDLNDRQSPSLDFNNAQLGANDKASSELNVRPPVVLGDYRRTAPYVSPLQAKNPWSYSLSVYPNFTFRKFKIDREKLDLIHRDFIDATQEAERGGFSLNVGFVVSRRIGRITYLNGGVEYINYKANTEYSFSNYREANINPVTERIEGYSLLNEPELINFSGNNVYHYLNIPFSISHQPWATDHVRLNIEAGGSFMYFLGANGQSIDYQTLEIIDIRDREYNNSIASLHMKVGVCYYLSEKFNFGLEPTMMYFTNTIYSEDYPFQVIPYSVGVNLKLQVKLN